MVGAWKYLQWSIIVRALNLRSIVYNASKTWNEMPSSIRNSGSLNVLKTSLKQYLLNARIFRDFLFFCERVRYFTLFDI